MRIKEQETCLTLQEHDDDDDDGEIEIGSGAKKISQIILQFTTFLYIMTYSLNLMN